MGSLRDEINSDLGKAIGLYEQTVSLKNSVGAWVSVACVRKSGPSSFGFEDGGEIWNVSEHILVQRSLFGAEIPLPAIGNGIDTDAGQIKTINPNGENLILGIGSFDASE